MYVSPSGLKNTYGCNRVATECVAFSNENRGENF